MTRAKGEDPGSTTIIDLQVEPRFQLFDEEMPYIQVEVVGGPMDGARGRVSAGELTIGRGDANTLSLPLDPRVSKRHARIVQEGNHFWLEDLKSSNGTFLGDERIEERALISPGIIFVLGGTAVEFTPL